jgi:glycosyltransferase involved in cell wall biosynthesis
MTKKKHTKFYPTVSVCTPTFNRRPFINVMFECFKNQTYPRDKTEWIIIDDGTDKIKDLVEKSGISQIKYFELDTKLTLGAKRNLMHEKTTGDIIVYMDDDDYYPPERIQHAVDMLMSNKEILIAGSSEMYVYFKHINKMYQAGPYNQNHATAATFAFRKELLNITRYNETKSLAEEKEFLKNYSIPMIQLDPLKTILVFSHIHNTFDKKELLKTESEFFKPSDKTVEYFIKFTKEIHIKKFFLYDIEQVLEEYKPGLPNLKPDVLKQISETKKTRLNEELKFHHSNFIRCVLELENSTIDVKPITEVECLKKLNMDLIIQLRNLSKMYEEKCAELNKRQTGEWDLVEKTE